jgi:hypothetical protein
MMADETPNETTEVVEQPTEVVETEEVQSGEEANN